MSDPTKIQNEINQTLENWREKEKKALSLLKLVGDLRFDKSVELVFYRQDVYDIRPSELIQLHTYSKKLSRRRNQPRSQPGDHEGPCTTRKSRSLQD